MRAMSSWQAQREGFGQAAEGQRGSDASRDHGVVNGDRPTGSLKALVAQKNVLLRSQASREM